MRFPFLPTVLAVSLALTVGAVQAKTIVASGMQVLECTFVGGRVNWITDKLYILRDVKTNEIQVYDGVIDYLFKKPIKATVVKDTSGRLELDWLIKNAPGQNGGAVPVSFHAILLKPEMKVLEKAVVSGYDNKESRSGPCVPSTK